MGLLGKMALGAAKKVVEHTIVDIVEGKNETFNKAKESMTKSHDDKIIKMAAGRQIITIENSDNQGKSMVRDHVGSVLYHINKE